MEEKNADELLRERIVSAASPEELKAIVEESGAEVSDEEAIRLYNLLQTAETGEGEVPDEVLEAVTGGGSWNINDERYYQSMYESSSSAMRSVMHITSFEDYLKNYVHLTPDVMFARACWVEAGGPADKMYEVIGSRINVLRL